MKRPQRCGSPHTLVRAPRRKEKADRTGRAEHSDRAEPRRNPAESPVAWLYSRRDGNGNPLISEAQFNAGEKLRTDFFLAQMSPRVTQSWSPSATTSGRRSAPGAGMELADSVVAAMERVRRALAAVGPELANVLIDVCCHLRGLEEAERRAGWPQRSGKIVLSVALSALARHYGFDRADCAAPGAARIRAWGAHDFRPAIDAAQD